MKDEHLADTNPQISHRLHGRVWSIGIEEVELEEETIAIALQNKPKS